MTESVNIDRAAIRSMVEDHWRSFLAVAKANPEIGGQSIKDFEARIQATAALMRSEQAQEFIQTVEEEREILFNEYKRDPVALKRRLGLTQQFTQPVIPHQQQGLGQMAVRTAVRATIWESVFTLFRLFR
jgi:hypothetical protein